MRLIDELAKFESKITKDDGNNNESASTDQL